VQFLRKLLGQAGCDRLELRVKTSRGTDAGLTRLYLERMVQSLSPETWRLLFVQDGSAAGLMEWNGGVR
jgi:hypothetical protein